LIVGIPTEIRPQEHRVGAVPALVHDLTAGGHQVLVQAGAGLGAGLLDEDYREAGARIAADAAAVYGEADLIVKVKEPLSDEIALIRPGQILFAFFHFAASRELTEAMLASGAHCFAYETLTVGGERPLLAPMSEIAGRMAAQVGACHLGAHHGGRGVLLGGVPGVARANVLVLGGGNVGANAARMVAGLGANVSIFDVDLDRLRRLDIVMPANVQTIASSEYALRQRLPTADLVIGAVLVSGARAPTLIRRAELALMHDDGPVIVDVAIDQGGCVETSRPTTHAAPTFLVDGVLHYCVANMPGAVPRTATFALTNASSPYVRRFADIGLEAAVADQVLATAANVVAGRLTHRAVAETFGIDWCQPGDASIEPDAVGP
jgi:alanine dehydrogenase